MINIVDKVLCCGCNACGDVCTHNAITFKVDMEGFWYPVIDEVKCTDCGLCDKVCPIINIEDLKKNDFNKPECYAAIHKNIEVRFDSTSGGLFSALAENMYRNGGYVGGAIYNEDFSVRHFISNTNEDLAALRSSKYLQSDTLGFYKVVKELLKNDKKVLVCGTPCQMAALRRFLRKDYDNLIIVDFICLGVNSPKVFRKYLDYLEERFQSKVIYFKAKNKELGWRSLTSKIIFENGQSYYDTKDTSLFTKGYLQTRVYCRPSCYDCRFKGLPRISDLTVADYWGAEETVGPELDNDMGTSLVIVNNARGKEYFKSISSKILFKEIPFESILSKNPALTKSILSPLVDRTEFYKKLDSSDFISVAEQFIMSSESVKTRIKGHLRKYYRIYRSTRLHLKPLYQLLRHNSITSLWNKEGMLLPTSYCVINIHKKARCVFKGFLHLGWKKFASSRLETRLLVGQNASLIVGDDYTLGYGSDIEVFAGATLEIKGKGATNIGATIICGEYISIGERVMMGRNVTIRDNNGNHYISRRGYKNTRPVIIGDKVWLCEGCTIMPGVKIGEGAIVGAKSVVFSNVPAHSIVSGNPAVVVDEDVYWKY